VSKKNSQRHQSRKLSKMWIILVEIKMLPPYVFIYDIIFFNCQTYFINVIL
jgi:hypothetical protein